MKVYLSSTYLDLKDYRSVLAKALRKAQYDIVMMEEYVARDALVEFACPGDVARCDVYLGVFAWRYGYIPDAANPACKSITELEYAAANSIPRLIFLLDENAAWPAELRDVDPTRIKVLRDNLSRMCAARFTSPDGLATEALAALRVLESTRSAERLDAVMIIQDREALGPSYLMNIKDHLSALQTNALVEVKIGPVPWWNTRLYLIAALAEDFGGTQELVFVDEGQRLLNMAPPSDVRRQLAHRWPKLKSAYEAFRQATPTAESVEAELWRYPIYVSNAFGGDESVAKTDVTKRDIGSGLRLAGDVERVDVQGKGQDFLLREVLGRQTPYVALTREGILESIVDARDLARRVAHVFLHP
ncbi:MAG TPA: DUF4062 domain-containing protein [Roseiarcus sp.]|jgi:hypothetical protein|nr:DUF4062 domain-containing protein [Roseiarcus sp.]